MVYEGINKEGIHSFGLATSADGVKWERKSNEPIFERSSPGRWVAWNEMRAVLHCSVGFRYGRDTQRAIHRGGIGGNEHYHKLKKI